MSDKFVKLVTLDPQVQGNNTLRLELDYYLGGHSFFSGQKNPRGFYLYHILEHHDERGYSYALGVRSNYKIALNPEGVKRKSKKALKDALFHIEENMDSIIARSTDLVGETVITREILEDFVARVREGEVK